MEKTTRGRVGRDDAMAVDEARLNWLVMEQVEAHESPGKPKIQRHRGTKAQSRHKDAKERDDTKTKRKPRLGQRGPKKKKEPKLLR